MPNKINILLPAATFLIGVATLALLPAPRTTNAADPQPRRDALTPGLACKIYFRGDASGQTAPYVATVTNNASLAGTIAAVDDQWVVLAADKHDYHIPRSSILLIDVTKK
jgi:hypothetical protein